MALKTFNLNEEIYKQFSKYCKKEGLSMSKKIENFIKQELKKLKNISSPLKQEITHIEKHPMHKYC